MAKRLCPPSTSKRARFRLIQYGLRWVENLERNWPFKLAPNSPLFRSRCFRTSGFFNRVSPRRHPLAVIFPAVSRPMKQASTLRRLMTPEIRIGDVFEKVFYAELVERAAIECFKRNLAGGDRPILAKYPLLISRAHWTRLLMLAETLEQEFQEAEKELLHRPELHQQLGIPKLRPPVYRERNGRMHPDIRATISISPMRATALPRATAMWQGAFSKRRA